MSLTVAKLVAETRSFVWHYMGEDIAVTYRPGFLTIAWNLKPFNVSLAEALVALDVLGEDGKPIALTPDSLADALPIQVMQKLVEALYTNSTVDPTPAGTSGAT